MSYGSAEWQGWVLGEEEGTRSHPPIPSSRKADPLCAGLKHIKAAYDMGINAFDTANVYSNGVSEVILGKAIKQYNLPRDEIVVMTKVFGLVERTPKPTLGDAPGEAYRQHYVNQSGLSRKVRSSRTLVMQASYSPASNNVKHIFESVKHSLDRLQLDYIDLLQCEFHGVRQRGWSSNTSHST